MALRIKALREAAGMTQEILAAKAGLSRSQLSEIENEKKPANTLRLGAIACALGVSVEELFDKSAKAAMAMEIVSLWPSIPDRDRETLIRMAEAFARK